MKKEELLKKIDEVKVRSAWSNGVKVYAYELIEDFEEEEFYGNPANYKALLNGASSWREYSFGGCSLIYDQQIALRLCTPSELKKTKNGELDPNKNENWLDVQSRALFQAENLIRELMEV